MMNRKFSGYMILFDWIYDIKLFQYMLGCLYLFTDAQVNGYSFFPSRHTAQKFVIYHDEISSLELDLSSPRFHVV